MPNTFHRPPAYKGGSLGGLSRLRAYDATRYNDQAAILYTLEYRYLLNYNPLKDVTMGGKLDVQWFELVPFAEVGRVAPAWNIETLHENMKNDVGVGLRAMVNNITIRIDVAYGYRGIQHPDVRRPPVPGLLRDEDGGALTGNSRRTGNRKGGSDEEM